MLPPPKRRKTSNLTLALAFEVTPSKRFVAVHFFISFAPNLSGPVFRHTAETFTLKQARWITADHAPHNWTA
jgi:hypothetical protein